MTDWITRCASPGCLSQTSYTIPEILMYYGWTVSPSGDRAWCPLHSEVSVEQIMKTRAEIDAEIVAANTQGRTTLPTDSQARKHLPLARGFLDYFPAAAAAVAQLSLAGNIKHNPGQELHHARGKSTDHADCVVRHLMERGTVDTDGIRHSVKVAWRALALLQEELEREEGAPLARAARLP